MNRAKQCEMLSHPRSPKWGVMVTSQWQAYLLLFLLVGSSFPLYAGPRQRVSLVPRGKITVDGNIGAQEWPIAGARAMACAIPVGGDASVHTTQAWFACDGVSLYVLVRVNVAQDKPLVVQGNWGGRDGIEIAFSDPRTEGGPIVSALCYPDGAFQGQSVGGTRATPEQLMAKTMTYAATAAGDHWLAEIGIPLQDMGISPTGLEVLNFNLNTRRMCDMTWMVWARTRGPVWAVDTAGKLLFGNDVDIPEDEEEMLVQQLNASWYFRADPESLGVKERWAVGNMDGAWITDRIDLHRGWGMQGYRDHVGWAWVRQNVELPADIRSAKRVWLLFPAVDEQCEVYLDGERVAEHTTQISGFPPGHLWNDPILIDVTQAWEERDKAKAIAVRVLAYSPSGGLRKPVFLIGSADKDVTATATYAHLADLGFLKPLVADVRMAEIPELPPHPAPQALGSRIQRTMTLLATSTAAMRHRVKILFYGQSITAGMHWTQITNALRQRFPYAIIETENRAIGGFTAPALCRTAVADLYTTDADLVLFHDYGGENTGELERMIQRLRQVSTADIMVYTHTVAWTDNPKGLAGRTRGDDISAAFNRYLAQKYNCELVEARKEWSQFLDLHGLKINEYMGDRVHSNVHPNAEGHTLLAELCLRHFQFNPGYPGGWAGNVRWIEARSALEEAYGEIQLEGSWYSDSYGITIKDGQGSLTVPFHGTRVDLVSHPDRTAGTFTMQIDGKHPAEFPELFACTKTDGIRPGDSWPVFKRVTLPTDKPPVPQTWTATVTRCDMKVKTFAYSIEGSVTGPDGEGSDRTDFVSNSGQIRIARKDCFLIWPLTYRKMTCPENLQIAWKVYPRFMQPISLGPAIGRSIERRITLFSGLQNGPHTLTLTWTGDAPAGIKALVVHRPPLD